MTSVAAYNYHGNTVAFTGTRNGRMKKVRNKRSIVFFLAMKNACCSCWVFIHVSLFRPCFIVDGAADLCVDLAYYLDYSWKGMYISSLLHLPMLCGP